VSDDSLFVGFLILLLVDSKFASLANCFMFLSTLRALRCQACFRFFLFFLSRVEGFEYLVVVGCTVGRVAQYGLAPVLN